MSPAVVITIPPRVPSVSPVRREGPVQRMRRAFATLATTRLTDDGRDALACLFAVPGVLATATLLAMMLAAIWQGLPA